MIKKLHILVQQQAELSVLKREQFDAELKNVQCQQLESVLEYHHTYYQAFDHTDSNDNRICLIEDSNRRVYTLDRNALTHLAPCFCDKALFLESH